jgi:hypothetical protein
METDDESQTVGKEEEVAKAPNEPWQPKQVRFRLLLGAVLYIILGVLSHRVARWHIFKP